MDKRISIIIFLLLSFGLVAAVAGQSPTRSQGPLSSPPLNLALQVYPPALAPGAEGILVLQVHLEPGWHLYGNPKGPGPGLPTVVDVVSLPPGVEVEAARFLPAQKYTDAALGEDAWVWAYAGDTRIFVPFRIGAEVEPGDHPVRLQLRGLLCRQGICQPWRQEAAARLRVGAGEVPVAAIPAAMVAALSRTHPGTETLQQRGFIGETGVEGEVIPELFPRPVQVELEVGGFLEAAIFALLAGLILNFTPCVLPVAGLKVLSLVQHAREHRRNIVLLSLCYGVGIWMVFLVLASLAAFAGHGWGDLFQRRGFLATMVILVFAMALSLFGVFHLPIPRFAARADAAARGAGYLGAIYRGALATFLATPCSGPLLGGAMAWTLLQPPPLIFLVFLLLGLGMAFPYVVMAIFPQTLKWLPRPGRWLLYLERFLGVLLLGTAAYLLLILDRDTRLGVGATCLALALGLLVYRGLQPDRGGRRRLVAWLALVSALAVGGWVGFRLLPPLLGPQVLAREQSSAWQPYSLEKLLAGAKAGRWVVVNFTADWCPNCIFVEKTTLENPQVKQAFRQHRALLLQADLTRENPAAKELLYRLGGRSIPFLALFPPGEEFKRPYFLRDLYRPRHVLYVFSQGK